MGGRREIELAEHHRKTAYDLEHNSKSKVGDRRVCAVTDANMRIGKTKYATAVEMKSSFWLLAVQRFSVALFW